MRRHAKKLWAAWRGNPTPLTQAQAWNAFVLLKERIIASDAGATELAVLALKSAILVNGAAAAALLAFLSQVSTHGPAASTAAVQLVSTLRTLVMGVAAGAIATATGYLSMYCETAAHGRALSVVDPGKRWVWLTNLVRWIAIALAGLSLAYFVIGMFEVARILPGLIVSAGNGFPAPAP